jgi:hypothetical protein
VTGYGWPNGNLITAPGLGNLIFLVYGFKKLNPLENGLNEGGDFMILGT